jgi:hypothetical protein
MPPSVLRTASSMKNKNLLKIVQNKEVSSSAASGKIRIIFLWKHINYFKKFIFGSVLVIDDR